MISKTQFVPKFSAYYAIRMLDQADREASPDEIQALANSPDIHMALSSNLGDVYLFGESSTIYAATRNDPSRLKWGLIKPRKDKEQNGAIRLA